MFTATSTAQSLGDAMGTVMDTSITTSLSFVQNATLITALAIGGVFLYFMSKLKRWF